MAVVVWHKPSGTRYVLIGTGYGAYRSQSPSFWGGALFPQSDMGEIPVAAVCDAAGVIHWFLTEELQVLEVDGVPVAKLLEGVDGAEGVEGKEGKEGKEGAASPDGQDRCPACGAQVSVTDQECPSCGLSFPE